MTEMLIVKAERLSNGKFYIDAWEKSTDDRKLPDNEGIRVDDNVVEIIARGARKESKTTNIDRTVSLNIGTKTYIAPNKEWRDAMNSLLEDVCNKAINFMEKNHQNYENLSGLKEAYRETIADGLF